MLRRPAQAVLLSGLALLAAAQPGLAQGQIRSVVVPAEGAVIIPPRSAPRLAARPASSVPLSSRAGNPVVLPDTGVGLAAPLVGMILPAIAGAVLGGSIAGSRGGGSSAPARTR